MALQHAGDALVDLLDAGELGVFGLKSGHLLLCNGERPGVGIEPQRRQLLRDAYRVGRQRLPTGEIRDKAGGRVYALVEVRIEPGQVRCLRVPESRAARRGQRERAGCVLLEDVRELGRIDVANGTLDRGIPNETGVKRSIPTP